MDFNKMFYVVNNKIEQFTAIMREVHMNYHFKIIDKSLINTVPKVIYIDETGDYQFVFSNDTTSCRIDIPYKVFEYTKPDVLIWLHEYFKNETEQKEYWQLRKDLEKMFDLLNVIQTSLPFDLRDIDVLTELSEIEKHELIEQIATEKFKKGV